MKPNKLKFPVRLYTYTVAHEWVSGMTRILPRCVRVRIVREGRMLRTVEILSRGSAGTGKSAMSKRGKGRPVAIDTSKAAWVAEQLNAGVTQHDIADQLNASQPTVARFVARWLVKAYTVKR